ncbi:hypothetical protein BP5796_08625 [Coleophoma crateriformis]|uniref:Wings apart-like protein C-terminal domain-containing protein n=1 Tax=Coleophoma crateriformis TaxID=565419 RepID=A0A3D8R8J3_9HELO|nr:hypothetical protein BP5796_08625 [Coleophoma crateriformis]
MGSMATLEDGSVAPRKRITTYGRAARRRIPEYTLDSPKLGSSDSVIPAYNELATRAAEVATNATVPQAPTSRMPSTLQPAGSDVFDMPDSDDGSHPAKGRAIVKKPSKLTSKTNKASRAEHKSTTASAAKAATIQQSLASLPSSTPGSPLPANIYDFPSSGEDAAPVTPKPVKKIASTSSQRVTQSSTARPRELVRQNSKEDQMTKRRKVSPEKGMPQAQTFKRASSLKPTSKVRSPVRLDDTRRQQQIATKTFPKQMATRPKLGSTTKSAPVLSPQKQPTIAKHMPTSGPTPEISSKTNGETISQHMPPRSLKMWKNLLETGEDADADTIMKNADEEPPIVPDRNLASASPSIATKTLSRPAGVIKRPQKPVRSSTRPRLIDTLVEQGPMEESSSEESDDSSDSESEAEEEEQQKMSHDQFAEILSQTLGQTSPQNTQQPASQGSQGLGPRFTYSRQRSMLAEEDMMQQLAIDLPLQSSETLDGERPRRGVIPSLKPLPSFNEDEEMTDIAPAVTSVHELRQAGANQRFLEEVEDLLDTIGKPSSSSSLRRSGLSELASKMKDKNFLRQFRANGVDQRVFLHLDQEQDIIAGFYMISILLVVLTDAKMPHIVAHLHRQGITKLLICLVGSPEAVLKIGKDRKNNMSKMALSLLSEHQSYLLTLSGWADLQLQPQLLSPRIVALKCLEQMVKQTREAGKTDDIFSKEMTTNLFEILKSPPDEETSGTLTEQRAIEFQLALSVLELHSIRAMTAQDETIWINEYLPIVADIVETCLSCSTEDFGVLQFTLLRLMVNVTNNDPNAANVFARKGVMKVLGQTIVSKFNMLSGAENEEDLSENIGQLIVALGVMINLAESDTARDCFDSLCGEVEDPLQTYVRLFTDNQERMLEANTQEESQRNIPFGYLSILLGYLCLSPAISVRVRGLLPAKSLPPLLTSIEQFISYHKAVDDILEAEDDDYIRQTGLTDRLQSLVDRLSATGSITG